MGIDFNRQFGAGSNSNNTNNNNRSDQPKAKIWLNIGYVVEGVPVSGGAEGEVENRFVSLPIGIPLDTMELLRTDARNAQFAQFQAARNDLHTQLMGMAEKLQPGEDKVFGIEGGLAIQIRRVSDERESVVADDKNPFRVELALPAN